MLAKRFNEHPPTSVELGVSAVWEKHVRLLLKDILSVSVQAMWQWTYKSPVDLGQSHNYQSRRCVCMWGRGVFVVVLSLSLVVIGEFSKWGFMEDSIRESSQASFWTFTYTLSSPLGTCSLNFLCRIIPLSVVWKSQIRSEARARCLNPGGKAPLWIFLLKSQQPRAWGLSKYIVKCASLQGK